MVSLLSRGIHYSVPMFLYLVILVTSTPAVDHVVHISIDGLRGDLLETLVRNDTQGDFAHFRRLQEEGAFTYNARTDFTHTDTLPNHTSMLTGRPVLRPNNQAPNVHHGYTNNGDPQPSWTLHNQGNPSLPYVASTLDVAHDHGLSTALYASKSKFVIYEQSYNATNGAPDTTGVDHGRDKVDVYVNRSSGASLMTAFLAEMSSNRFNYSFVHILDPDSAGHAQGWGSAGWTQSVRNVDGYLADLFDLLDSDPTLQRNTAIVLTTDHGGSGTGHGNASSRANYTIPFFAWGPGIPAGQDIYTLLTNRHDPGLSRPSYDDPNQPLRNGDSGNLALALLGLPSIPGSIMLPHLVPEPSCLALGICLGSAFGLVYLHRNRRRVW